MSLFGWQTVRAQHTQTDRPSRPALAQQASVKVDYAVTTIPVRTTVDSETQSVIAGKVMIMDSSGRLSPVPDAYISIEQSGERRQDYTDSTGVYKATVSDPIANGSINCPCPYVKPTTTTWEHYV